MGISRKEIFSDSQNKLADIAKALGHPARIAIVEQVLNQEGCVCGDMVSETGLAQATISQHLKELRDAKILKGSVEGTKMCYCIDSRTFAYFSDMINSMLQSACSKGNCC